MGRSTQQSMRIGRKLMVVEEEKEIKRNEWQEVFIE
jgi:hypothetical protein